MQNKKPSFKKDGYGFLISFARKTKGKPFCAESVTLAAEKAGILPPDLRNWGKYFALAAREGYITRCSVVYERTMGHGSLTLGWMAL